MMARTGSFPSILLQEYEHIAVVTNMGKRTATLPDQVHGCRTCWSGMA